MNTAELINFDKYENCPMYLLSYPCEHNLESGIEVIHCFSMDEVEEHINLFSVSYYCVEVI